MPRFAVLRCRMQWSVSRLVCRCDARSTLQQEGNGSGEGDLNSVATVPCGGVRCVSSAALASAPCSSSRTTAMGQA